MKKNLKQIIVKTTYNMGNLNKKLLAVNKAYKEVKGILNQKEK